VSTPQHLSPAEHEAIAQAVRLAEARTSGEIFVVVAAQSGGYRVLPILWAALATLIAGWLAMLWSTLANWWSGWNAASIAPDTPAWSLAVVQALAFVVLAALASIPALRIYFVPRAMRRARAAARAREQFLAHNLHATQDRTGVLLFISLAEHHAEIVADAGINSRVPENFWADIVDRLTAEIAAGRLTAGLVAAIEACGAALAQNFPPKPADENELPDRLVEI
jgi:putative membrane protein